MPIKQLTYLIKIEETFSVFLLLSRIHHLGYKQTGQSAIKPFYVFVYFSYEKLVDIDNIHGPIICKAISQGQAFNFFLNLTLI